MGCDGGTIQKRIELVKLAKKPEQKDAGLERGQRWFFCALSKEPLAPPVVADDLGRLYNKEAVLRLLIDRKAFGDAEAVAKHIESLKDVTQLQLTENPSPASAPAILSSTKNDAVHVPRFICPVSMREMNGRLRFSHLPCGHAFSEQALRELGGHQCAECGAEFAEEDVVPINSEKEEEVERLKERMARRKAKRAEEEAERKARRKAEKAEKAGKKDKSAVKPADGGNEAPADSGVGTSGGSGEEISDEERQRRRDKEKKRKRDEGEDILPGLALQTKKVSNINMVLPSLRMDDVSRKIAGQTEAIRSIYSKNDSDQELAPLYRGTFGR
ncbi:Rtf2 RING-finger-domain-containing protein [Hyaloraphidium curvatum]|nr:Rtf2 RING-finger-domain-containing protein [Hyaloraphidium curvatum]